MALDKQVVCCPSPMTQVAEMLTTDVHFFFISPLQLQDGGRCSSEGVREVLGLEKVGLRSE